MNSRWWLGGLALALLAPYATHAQPAKPQRWVRSDDVRVRSGPSAEHRIVGTLPRGAPVVLHGLEAADGFCSIEGDGHSGYVACSYLSAQPVARARAGADGIDAAQRWVSGNGVTLRDAPAPTGAVVARLPLNAIVKLVRAAPGGAYCEVQAAAGPGGFTACRFLATTPVVLAHVRGDHGAGEAPNTAYDPERAFWLAPGWDALERYAQALERRPAGKAATPRWPRNEGLERMKAHLALGIHGPKPRAYADWAALKRKAAQDLDLAREAWRLTEQGKAVPAELAGRAQRTEQVVRDLDQALGLWGMLPDAPDGGSDPRVVRLVRALELPAVAPSLFRSEAELAPPDATAEQASGRFAIVFRQVLSPRPQPKADEEEGGTPGLYDMLARTQVLARPVKRVQLFRNGQLRVEPASVRAKQTLWREADPPMCEGWVGGFAFGDADKAIWRYVDGGIEDAGRNPNPAGSLYAFYTTLEVAPGTAARSETPMRLERAATGFIGGVLLHYDLNADGIADLAVWEGQGRGPGHLDGPTKTDDRWYRLAFANVNGAWKVLGSDSFGYGCGC